MGMSKSSYWLDFLEKKQQWNMTGKPTHPPLVDASELLSKWKIFRRALVVEKKSLMDRKNSPILSPTMQDILEEMMKSKTYEGVFPETWKLLNIMMALPVSTATVEMKKALKCKSSAQFD